MPELVTSCPAWPCALLAQGLDPAARPRPRRSRTASSPPRGCRRPGRPSPMPGSPLDEPAGDAASPLWRPSSPPMSSGRCRGDPRGQVVMAGPDVTAERTGARYGAALGAWQLDVHGRSRGQIPRSGAGRPGRDPGTWRCCGSGFTQPGDRRRQGGRYGHGITQAAQAAVRAARTGSASRTLRRPCGRARPESRCRSCA